MKLILFLKLAYKCIYFLDFYPATIGSVEESCNKPEVMSTVCRVYSRVVDISRTRSLFVVVSARQQCGYVHNVVGLYLLSSITRLCLPLQIFAGFPNT